MKSIKLRNGGALAVMALAIILALMTACAKPAPIPTPSKATPATPATAPTPAKITAGTPGGKLVENFIFVSSPGGKVKLFSAAFSEMLNRHGPMKSQAQASPGAMDQFRLLKEGTAHCLFWSGIEPLFGYYGQQGYSQTKFRMLASSGFPSATIGGVYTTPGTGIKSIKDIRDKKWLADYTGMVWMSILSEAVLKANGMTKANVKWLDYTDHPQAFREVKEGRASAVTGVMGADSLDMASSTGIYVIPLTPAEQAAIHEAMPGFSPFVVPKGHEGANADTPTMASDVGIWVYPTLSDITAYSALKTFYQYIDEFHATMPAAKGFTLKTALSLWIVPYHPGAIAYFKEAGIWGAEEDKKQEALLKQEAKLFKE